MPTFPPLTPAAHGVGIALLATAGLAVAAPSPAAAAAGATTLRPSGPAARALAEQRVRVTAAKPARATRTTWTLPVAGGTVTRTTAALAHGGSLRLKAGRRTLSVTGLRLTLGGRSTIAGRVGGRTRTLFTVTPARKRGPALDATARSVRLSGARVDLTAAGATAIRRGLRLPRVARGRFGTLAVRAALPASGTPPVAPGPAPTTPAVPLPAAATCSTADPGDVRYPGGYPVVPGAAAVPPTRWTLRASLVDYVLRRWASVAPAGDPLCSQTWGRLVGTGGAAVGTAAAADGGSPAVSIVSLVHAGNAGAADRAGTFAAYRATPDGDYASTAAGAPRYQSRFQVRSVSRNVGTDEVTVQLDGTVQLDMPAHLIDTRISDPTIVIAAGRQTARVYADGRDSGDMAGALAGAATPKRWQRLYLLDLALSAVTPTDAGGTRTWAAVPATIAPDAPGATPSPDVQHSAAAAIGSGQYPAGSPFGSFTVSAPIEELGP